MNNNDIEYKSVEEIKAFQEELLHKALTYLQANSPYYQRMFKSYGININKIKHIEDLVKIPFTEKKDLQRGVSVLRQIKNHRLHYHIRNLGRSCDIRLLRKRPTATCIQRKEIF